MPPIETSDLKQDAVTWPALPYADHQGEVQVSPTPVGLKVRWTDVTNVVSSANQNTVGVDAKVVVSVEVPINSVLWKGRLADLPSPGNVPTSGFYVVKTVSNTPDLKNRRVRRELGLQRYGDVLPVRSGP